MAGFYDTGLWITIAFILGYTLITIEHFTKIDKATTALLMAVVCWVIQFLNPTHTCEENTLCLGEHMGAISQVVFFILGALTVVEVINLHKGFTFISERIRTNSKQVLLWTVGIVTFVLSGVLDNLTTTIVMVTLLRKIISNPEDRLLIGGGVVIAANAGGAWTPIGDVTTTMLWIGGQLTVEGMLTSLFWPSIVCFFASFAYLHFMLKGDFTAPKAVAEEKPEPYGRLIFFLGIALLVFVPVFKVLTGLPPFMGMLFAMSILWVATDVLHVGKENRSHLRVPHALTRLDFSSVLFFLGILLAVEALNTAGVLTSLAQTLDENIGNPTLIAVAIGLASAVVDNVPLVAASMGMYSMVQYPVDSDFWNLVAFCAGTGGSILIIGSAAGVVFMGMERVNFYWYMRKISLPAAIGYFAGIAVYLILSQ